MAPATITSTATALKQPTPVASPAIFSLRCDPLKKVKYEGGSELRRIPTQDPRAFFDRSHLRVDDEVSFVPRTQSMATMTSAPLRAVPRNPRENVLSFIEPDEPTADEKKAGKKRQAFKSVVMRLIFKRRTNADSSEEVPTITVDGPPEDGENAERENVPIKQKKAGSIFRRQGAVRRTNSSASQHLLISRPFPLQPTSSYKGSSTLLPRRKRDRAHLRRSRSFNHYSASLQHLHDTEHELDDATTEAFGVTERLRRKYEFEEATSQVSGRR